jgi:ferric-dicitrate binding protein FerR (iron transport regulator)
MWESKALLANLTDSTVCMRPSACLQFNRTIQNYQKAYRKKVEGLKTELKATRNTNEALRRQVRQLKSATRVHIPSLAVGLAVGLAGIWLPRLRSYFTGKQQQQRGDAEQPKEEAADGSSSQEQQQQQQVQQGGAQSIPEEAVKADSAA